MASVVLIGAIAGLGYWGFIRDTKAAPPATTQEVKVTVGSLSTTLTASGTAAAEQSTPLTFSAGGLVTEVLVRLGDEVKSGQPLVRLDARDATRAVETAQAALTQAQLRLQQLVQPSAVDRTSMIQTVISARTQLENAQATYANLDKPPTASALLAAQNAVAQAKLGIQSAQNSVDNARASLGNAQNAYCKLWQEATIAVCTPEALPVSAELVAKLQASIARGSFVPSDALLSAVPGLISSNSSYINALSGRETAAATLATAEANLAELTAPADADERRVALAALQNAQASYDSALARSEALTNPSALDLSVEQQSVRTAEIALQKAQDALADMTLVAPFNGKVGAVAAIVGQRIGSGANAVVLANPDAIRMDLTIAEADLVNIKPGMLGLARFDSLPRNAYVVRVLGVSPVPTVTQGVVTYPVQAAILRGNALNDIRDQLPSLTRALSSGASGAQFGALLGTGGPGGGAGGAGGQRPQGSGTPGAGGGQGGQRAQGTGTPPGSGTPTASATGSTPGGTRGPGAGGPGAGGAGAGGGAGVAALLNPPLPSAGMNASITLLVSVTENQLLVPAGAVRRQGNQTFVYVPGEGGGTPVQKAVVTAGTDGTNTAITSGVAEGDVVLLGAIGTATPARTGTAAAGGPGGGPAGVGGGPGGGIR